MAGWKRGFEDCLDLCLYILKKFPKKQAIAKLMEYREQAKEQKIVWIREQLADLDL